MSNFIKNLSLLPKGIRYKLLISFSLMAIIPLLVCGYLIKDYIFPPSEDFINISLILFFTVLITVLGLVFAKRMVNPVIEMAGDAKLIANGDLERRIKVYEEDEIGDLATSINKITSNIKENLHELKLYEARTKEINVSIHEKVISLSNLLKIGELIAQSTKLDEILAIILEKIAQIRPNGFSAFYLLDEEGRNFALKISHKLDVDKLTALKIRPGEGFLGRIISEGRTIVFDFSSRGSRDLDLFAKEYNLNNFVLSPIILRKNLVGFIIAGNYNGKEFRFKEDDMELIRIYARQLSLAVENNMLSEKIKTLAIIDDVTGLYNDAFIRGRLKEEIERAILFQRPCAFILFEVDNFDKFKKLYGQIEADSVLRKIAKVIVENISKIGKAGRIGDNEFAILIPEKNKRESTDLAENIKRKIEQLALGKSLTGSAMNVTSGVSENPLDGASAEELMSKARQYIRSSKHQK